MTHYSAVRVTALYTVTKSESNVSTLLNSLAVTEVTQQFSNAGRCYHLLESVRGLVLIQHLSPQFHHLQQFLLLVSFTQSHTHTHTFT